MTTYSSTLRAGPLAMLFDNGDLRYVRLGDREIIRRIYVAVRDHNWATILPTLSNYQFDVSTDSFRISYDAEHRRDPIHFTWHCTITGDAKGEITFAMDGEAHTTFMRNRIGICTLHPISECAGLPCHIEHVDGQINDSEFPLLIAPHQPFLNMRALSYAVTPEIEAVIRFEGDTFETEDQRNWLDASYKTYSTPISLPYPAEIRAGTRISQVVTLTLRGDVPQISSGVSDESVAITVVKDAPPVPLPQIGLSAASHSEPLSPRAVEHLQALKLSHLRVDVRLSDADYPAQLERAAVEARALDVPLHLGVRVADVEALHDLAQRVGSLSAPVQMWFIFRDDGKESPEQLVQTARAILTSHLPDARIGGGSNTYFTELNRMRPPASILDRITFSFNPQVHAFDNLSIAETPQTLPYMLQSARAFCGDTPLHIGPVTLKMRYNPDATGAPAPLLPGHLPPQVDARQVTPFAATWTLAILKHLAEGGVESATFYETTGWRGVMETEAGSPPPFLSKPGEVFPIWHALAKVAEFSGGEVLPTRSSAPLRVESLLLRQSGRTLLILANLTGERQRVRLPEVTDETVATVENREIALNPYELAWMDA